MPRIASKHAIYTVLGAGEVAQWLDALLALPVGLDSQHPLSAGLNYLELQFQGDLMSSSGHHGHACVYAHPYTHIKCPIWGWGCGLVAAYLPQVPEAWGLMPQHRCPVGTAFRGVLGETPPTYFEWQQVVMSCCSKTQAVVTSCPSPFSSPLCPLGILSSGKIMRMSPGGEHLPRMRPQVSSQEWGRGRRGR